MIMPNKKNKNFEIRPVPEASPEKSFDRYLKGGVDSASVNESLSEIYQDDTGKRVNVKQVNIKPKRGFFTWLGIVFFYALILGIIAFGVYYFVIKRNSDTSTLDVAINAPDSIVANESFSYTIDYTNQEASSLENLELTVVYPDNFIFESSVPELTENNNKWKLDNLRQFASGSVTITGRLIAPVGASNLVFADLTYHPSNITSEFKKSASKDLVVSETGLTINAETVSSTLVGQETELLLNYKKNEKNAIDNFSIRFDQVDNLEFPKADYGADVSMTEPGLFHVSSLDSEEKILKIKYKFKDKKNDTEKLKISYEFTPDENGKTFVFGEKTFDIQIVKNSLNLTVSVNGQASDQGINFGQTANYSISYVNKGDEAMNDVIIMAVLDGEALDWRKLVDKNNGKVSGRTIVWTKDEIPELKNLTKEQEGTIDFSIPVRSVAEAGIIRNFEIKSYAQFAVSGKSEDLSAESEANRSNQLSVKVNSDTSLAEAVRYFDQDNIAVGTGPLPPQVGQVSTFKVYWKITNSLHELGALKITTKLPDYVSWDGKDQADAGTLFYNESTNEVTWEVGRLPLSATNLEAQFSISIKPRATDRNKLLILVSGTTLKANDNQTTYEISQILKAQTTKLENDDIADTNGIVQ